MRISSFTRVDVAATIAADAALACPSEIMCFQKKLINTRTNFKVPEFHNQNPHERREL